MKVKEKRIRVLREGNPGDGPVIYWMSRDQRARHNWALLFAQQLALEKKSPLAVLFCLVPDFLGATMRQYGFMLRGLEELEKALSAKNIPLVLLMGNPREAIPRFVRKHRASALVGDFDPLRVKRQWQKTAKTRISIPFYEVDAHNVVPCWIASGKQEYGAYTIRPKIRKVLGEYLEDFPALRKHPHAWKGRPAKPDWQKARGTIKADQDVPEVTWIRPGEKAAQRALRHFVEKKLGSYDSLRNDPTADGQSDLSPYLHFGQLSAQHVALTVTNAPVPRNRKESFLEELIVRRELSDNYCYYNSHYDGFSGFPDWAKKTLDQHRKDRREYLYRLRQFEQARTHDELWNAAQREMVVRGKMHGYMRMYWAKKILQWTGSPEEAQKIAIYLNDRYELDGRDPNGYTGIAWSIGGVHDRAWNERPVFGKIRYMSYGGAKGKFDVKAYMKEHPER